jgi:hypothetical protein
MTLKGTGSCFGHPRVKLSAGTVELFVTGLFNFLGCRHRTGRDVSIADGAE